MDKLLQEKLVEVIELGKMGILEAVGVVKTQAPELVQQFMMFETFRASFGIILSIALLSIGVYGFLYAKKEEWKSCCSDPKGGRVTVAIMIGIIGSGIGILVTLVFINTLAKILIAPNVYILENLLTLLK